MKRETHLHPLYFDENFPLRAVQELRAIGHDCLTVQEDGKAGEGYPDDCILQDAAALGRVVVTFDRRDFRRLHRAGKISHRGIVLCTDDLDCERLAANIHAALSKKETMDGEVVYVYRRMPQ